MYLILKPADIFYLTWVIVHEVGEIMILIHAELWMENNTEIIFCDSRTRDLFDKKKYTLVWEREEWGENLLTYQNIITDPTCLTQELRDKIEWWGVLLAMWPSPVTQKRVIKNPDEIEKLRESQRINRAVYETIQPYIHIGVTEAAIARKIQILQLELGASGPSFPPIVAFWENSAVPHHSPTNRVLQEGDIILIDMGVIYQGYCSDMTRCILPNI